MSHRVWFSCPVMLSCDGHMIWEPVFPALPGEMCHRLSGYDGAAAPKATRALTRLGVWDQRTEVAPLVLLGAVLDLTK